MKREIANSMGVDPRMCYLCGTPLARGDPFNMDHVPPQRFFARSLRKRFGPQLATLPTHVDCNSEYRQDEEYFVLAAYAHDSLAGRALMHDLQRGLQQGHSRGLYDSIKKGFGKVVVPDGRFLFEYDKARIDRVIWKIVRGMFYLQHARVLPIRQPFECSIVPPTEAEDKLPSHDWFSILMHTSSLCEHGAVFDMRAIGGTDGALRMHFQAFLFWDRIIALVRFHDPTCPCEECAQAQGDHRGIDEQ
jgi:hypothetical protein